MKYKIYNAKQKTKKMIFMLSLILVLVILSGITYAYFSATVINNNKTETKIKSNTLGLIYTGVHDIDFNDIIPGDYMNKTFTVENTSNRAVDFNIYIEDIINEFNEDLVYSLKDGTNVIIDEEPLPSTKNGKTYLKEKILIDSGVKKNYTLTIKLKYSKDVDQTSLQGKVFNGTLGIDTEKIESNLNISSKLYTIVSDKNSNGIAEIGDEINITGTNENFYIIKNDGNKINALAKYNLNVGDNANLNAPLGIQDESCKGYVASGEMYGNVSFSNNNGWPHENDIPIDIQSYDGPVKDAINGYKEVMPGGIDVRLITKFELEELGCGSWTCINAEPWVYSTSYWTGSSINLSDYSAWHVETDAGYDLDFTYFYSGRFGVRPVIEFDI